MDGKLFKWTNVVKRWKYRWVVLDVQAGLLSYFISRREVPAGVPRGTLRLNRAVIDITNECDCTFSVTSKSKTFHLRARDEDELYKWVRCIEKAIVCANKEERLITDSQGDFKMYSSAFYYFEKQIKECDAYIQIILKMVRIIESRMNASMDNLIRERFKSIRSCCDISLKEAKHSIILLQIVKNAHMVNSDQITKLTEINSSFVENTSCPSIVAFCTEDKSSNEDDDFFDANENDSRPGSNDGSNEDADDFEALSQKVNSNKDMSQENTGHIDSAILNRNGTASSYLKPDGTFNYDLLYEDAYEGEISLENHGSVIKHLISQVKIGMDLSKVTLPIFILETRSLLEMFADYFSHPEMFVRIVEIPSERERMVQVLRWYLCSYHAGRKDDVARKPYNPVLGEIFQCYWDVPGMDSSKDQLVKDGPLPWCRASHLTFIAEQVSHHPPISAFYAEHLNKRISFSASIWTKSKFLGLSIGVHNIGKGVIHVMDFDETYIVTFPTGYGRSILTVPWIELGGSVAITCEKSGYRSTVEFQTKPFYGGKKHGIYCEVFSPNESKPFLTLSGEWNGVIKSKWSNGRSGQFVDVKNLDVTKKIVRPIEQQDNFESRRLWKDVTAGLKLNNMELASEAKHVIEQNQRLDAKQREESGIIWKPKHFIQNDCGDWVYSSPLYERG